MQVSKLGKFTGTVPSIGFTVFRALRKPTWLSLAMGVFVFFKWGMDFLLVRSLLAFNLQHNARELWKILKVSGIAGRSISESRHWTLDLPRQCHEMRNFPGRFLENPRDWWVCWEDCRLLQTCILDHFCRALNAEITTIRVCPQLWLWVSLHYTLCSSGTIRFIG